VTAPAEMQEKSVSAAALYGLRVTVRTYFLCDREAYLCSCGVFVRNARAPARGPSQKQMYECLSCRLTHRTP
jgi:hypothetical protein